MRSLLVIILLFWCARMSGAQPPVASFTENRGQWPQQVLYRTLVPGGALFVERDAFTYSLHRGGPMAHHVHDGAPAEPLRQQVYRVHFEGASPAAGTGAHAQPYYQNFFLGNDPARWGTHCAVFGDVQLSALYPGIDLRVDGTKGLEYDLLVAPGADPALIDMRFEGQNGLTVRDGRLIVHTSLGDVVEEAPVAYQDINGLRREVPCRYQLRNGHVTFVFPRGYDRTLPLVIDPVLNFSSFSGSTADNFGFTATYDDDGALYGGGIVFDNGYPTTTGVIAAGFLGGNIDISLSKWSPDGGSLEWSTYVGGSANETPHSLVVNSNRELFLLAATGSPDYPTTGGCYDGSFNGGAEIPSFGGWANLSIDDGYGHPLGTDIAVTHFNAGATALIGSTFVGGSGNDGVNNSGALAYNYGDQSRGEIALDAQERPVISTSTQSSNAPITPGAPQSSFGGGQQDAYLFRMNASLTQLLFATFYGGSQDDSGYGVQFASNGEIYMTGGTASPDLPMSGTPLDGSYNGAVDGYVARYAANGLSRLSSTYIGTGGEDQSYLVQLNTSDEVFVVGQTHGNFPVTPGKYANPGSSQFIQKFAPDLSSSPWSTRIGNGSGVEDLSPSAFLVSDCGQIYFSGWGGTVNHFMPATSSNTHSLPVTSDAYQHNTDGSDYYLMVLDPEASGLNYATYFGGPQSLEHVDGGTSRFDKQGNVYQAVCGGCGGFSDYPTTPGAWSNTNNSSNCNLAVFKFDLSRTHAVVDISGNAATCAPATVQFTNQSSGGTTYDWSFGDGGTSSAFEPSHEFTDPGTYTVVMVLTDSNGCAIADTASINVGVIDPNDASIDPVPTICTGQQVQLHAHGGDNYHWSPPDGLDDPASADPTMTATATITYTVVVTDACGNDTATISVNVGIPAGGAAPDTAVCIGNSVRLYAEGGGSYAWTPTTTLDDPTAQTPFATPDDTTMYYVSIVTPDGCAITDSMQVIVQYQVPDPTLTDTAVCLGSSVQLLANDGDRYAWQPAEGITDLHVPDPSVDPAHSLFYVVDVSNACGTTRDSLFVDVHHVIADAWPDTLVCPGERVLLHATGGINYTWSPEAYLQGPSADTVAISTTVPTLFQVIVRDALQCADTAFAQVDLFPAPTVFAGTDRTVEYGHPTQLQAFGDGAIVWLADPTLSCDPCIAPIATPFTSTTYTVQLTDTNGCKATDQVIVFVDGNLFVPNTFTPNGDGVNDMFFAQATEVKAFKLYVFNRWGEKIYEADQLTKSWDGTYQGVESPIDTYVWRVDLTELNGSKHTSFGHVNLLR